MPNWSTQDIPTMATARLSRLHNLISYKMEQFIKVRRRPLNCKPLRCFTHDEGRSCTSCRKSGRDHAWCSHNVHVLGPGSTRSARVQSSGAILGCPIGIVINGSETCMCQLDLISVPQIYTYMCQTGAKKRDQSISGGVKLWRSNSRATWTSVKLLKGLDSPTWCYPWTHLL